MRKLGHREFGKLALDHVGAKRWARLWTQVVLLNIRLHESHLETLLKAKRLCYHHRLRWGLRSTSLTKSRDADFAGLRLTLNWAVWMKSLLLPFKPCCFSNTLSPLHTNLQVSNFQRYKCAPICQLSYCTTMLFKVLYCKVENVFFIFCVCVCFLCTTCVNSIINLLQHSTI